MSFLPALGLGIGYTLVVLLLLAVLFFAMDIWYRLVYWLIYKKKYVSEIFEFPLVVGFPFVFVGIPFLTVYFMVS